MRAKLCFSLSFALCGHTFLLIFVLLKEGRTIEEELFSQRFLRVPSGLYLTGHSRTEDEDGDERRIITPVGIVSVLFVGRDTDQLSPNLPQDCGRLHYFGRD